MSVVLSEHLPLLASAPDGIQKLRVLILELAVRGKLVPQDPDDEPASELLKRIAKERARLEAAGICKKSKPMPPVGEEEQPFVLPNGWEWQRLDITGQYINGLAFKPSDWGRSGRPIIRIQNLSGRNDDFNYTEKDVSNEYLVARGDILVSWSATLDAFIWDRDVTGVLNQHIFRVVPSEEISRAYLFWLLRAVIREMADSEKAHGLVMKHINRGPFLSHVIALPPIDEQHRIVAKVDELMALCDRLEAEQADVVIAHARLVETLLGTLTQSTDAADLATNWQRLAEHFDVLFTTESSIDALKQTIIHLAYSARLTKSDIDGWRKAKLSEITDAVADIDHKMPKAVSEGVIFLSAKDLKDNGTLDFSQPKYISREDFERLSRRICPRRGDIIYSRIGARLGKARLVEVDTEFLVSYSCCVVRPKLDKVDKHYLVKFLDSRLALDQAHLGKQSIGVPDLGLGVIKAFEVPLPSIDEQHRIVAKVDEFMAFCDHLKADLVTARQHQTTLADTLIKSALEAA